MKRVVDVSYHNNVDLKIISKLSDISGAIIRAGYSTVYDTKAQTNVKICLKNGIPFGLYWYSYAITKEEVEKEVDFFIRFVVSNKSIGVPLFLDMEDADNKKSEKLKKEGLKWDSDIIKTLTEYFLRLLNKEYEKYGKIGLYSSQSYYRDYLDDIKNPICSDIDIIRWVARWSVNPPTVLSDIWQYTNSYHWLDGTSTDASLMTEQTFENIFLRSKAGVNNESQKTLADYSVQQMIDEIMSR